MHRWRPSVMYYQNDPKVSQFFCIGSLVHILPFLSSHVFLAPSFPFVLFFSFFSLPRFPSLLLPFPFPLLFLLPFPSLLFHFSLIFFPCPKILWFLSPPWGGGNYRRIYTPVGWVRINAPGGLTAVRTYLCLDSCQTSRTLGALIPNQLPCT